MASTPMPDLTAPQNVGFVETDTAPIIHSVRWRHLPARHIFTDVGEVIRYHENNLLVINMAQHKVSYLDIYLLRNVTLSNMRVYLRFIRDTDGVLIEEPYTIGEGGATIKLENDPVNPELQVVKGIAFTQEDLGNGTPMYDFPSMSNEGIYEVWLKAVTNTGNELHVRVPFEWDLSAIPPTDPDPDPDPNTPGTIGYDEYQVIIIEGSSPFTKRPTTHYRMAGVGVLEVPHCFTRIETPGLPSISKPSDDPIVGDKPVEPCALTVVVDKASVNVGEIVKLIPTHVNTSGILDELYVYDTLDFKEVGDGEFESLRSGTATISVTIIYRDGQECTVDNTVTSIQLPPPCTLQAIATKTSMAIGETFKINMVHGNASGVANEDIVYDVASFTYDVATEVYTAKIGGAYMFTIAVEYKDGQRCLVTLAIDVAAPTPPPEPPPGTLLCGQQAEGGTGFGEFKYQVTETGKYYIAYNFDAADDTMHLWIGGKKVYSSPTTNYDNGSPFSFNYKPSDGELKVVMNDGSTGTYWTYTLYCPSNVPAEVKDSPKLKHVN